MTPTEHKGDYLCLHCDTCFGGYSEEHYCYNFVENFDVMRGRFTPEGDWFFLRWGEAEVGRVLKVQLDVIRKVLPSIFESSALHWAMHENMLTAEEREALTPEALAPWHIRRKK